MGFARTFRSIVVLACYGCSVFGLEARAEDRYFIGLPNGGSANWNEPLNWSGGSVPGESDVAWLTHNDALDRSVSLDVSTALTGLLIGNPGGGLTTIHQLPGVNLTASYEAIGAFGAYPQPYERAGGAHVQNGGTNSIGSLDLGGYSSSYPNTFGLYSLNSGILSISSLRVGAWGDGTFQQSGGITDVDSLTVGFVGGSDGVYKLGAGALNVTGETVGLSGAATFLHTGGAHVVAGRLWVSYTPSFDGGGMYVLSGAGATLTNNEVYIGRGGGTFIQSAGMHHVQSQAVVGYSGGQYDLTGGTFEVLGELDVGLHSNGTFNHSGGAVVVGSISNNGTFVMGDSDGVYRLAGSSASLSVWGREYIGYGNATFHHSAGTHFISADLNVSGYTGPDSLSTSRYVLQGGSLKVGGSELIGSYGPTTFTQGGGNNISARVIIGAFGTYALSGGALSTPMFNISEGGRFTWGGGALSVSTLALAGQMTLTRGSGRTLVVNSLEIDPRAPGLDLTDNAMVIDYPGPSPGPAINELRQDLRDGAVFSSTSIPSGAGTTRLAYADNRVLQLSGFAGQTFPPGDFTQLLVMPTFAGDTNLDGQVDMTDLAALATHWQSTSDWTSGDFDYSGFIDITDLGLLATNWQSGVANEPTTGFDDALASLGLPPGSVPEAGLTPALAGACSLLSGRCARRQVVSR